VASSGSEASDPSASDWRPGRPPRIALAALEDATGWPAVVALVIPPAPADAGEAGASPIPPPAAPPSSDPPPAVPPLAAVPPPAGPPVPVPPAAATRLAAGFGVDVAAVLRNENATGAAGEVITIPLGLAAPRRLLLVGRGDGEPGDARSAGAALSRRAGTGDDLTVVLDGAAELAPASLRAFVEGFSLAAYRIGGPTPPVAPAVDQTPADAAATALDIAPEAGAAGTDGPEPREPGGRTVTLRLADPADPAATRAVELGLALARAVFLARDLINMPSLVKTPEWLAERAVEVARAAGLSARVVEPDELAAGGFGGLVAVGSGSPRGPRLVELGYAGPDGPDGPSGPRPHRVLVGKGVTFDSGGLSLKPPLGMTEMKTDMSGAAAVLATLSACAAFGVAGDVRGVLCLAENMIDGAAMRPGDVITTRSGRTVEVLNTDAEGRLVLADGLAYALEGGRPDAMVDIATLTGAIAVALGRRTAGLFSSDDALAAALGEAASRAGERVWRLPLVEDYRPALASSVADLTNVGKAPETSAGSITAALFLREFSGGVPWAHLDIANTARSDADDGEISKGGTGWGVRTLLAWLAGPDTSYTPGARDIRDAPDVPGVPSAPAASR